MYSVMSLLPDRRSGFVVLINGEAEAARTVLNEVLLKRFTKLADDRDVASYADELAKETESKQSATPQPAVEREAPTAEQFAQWWGVYRDPWFGEVRICPEGGQARFVSEKSPLLSGRIMRSGSRYLVDWDRDSVDAEAWLDFHKGDPSQPARLTLAKVDPEADFSYDYEDLAFERIRDCD